MKESTEKLTEYLAGAVATISKNSSVVGVLFGVVIVSFCVYLWYTAFKKQGSLKDIGDPGAILPTSSYSDPQCFPPFEKEKKTAGCVDRKDESRTLLNKGFNDRYNSGINYSVFKETILTKLRLDRHSNE